MKIKVLNIEKDEFDIENSGFSLLIETDGINILFDVGLLNDKENIENNLKGKEIKYIVLSHGHIDHTEGLKYLKSIEDYKIVCHPSAIIPKTFKQRNIGIQLNKDEINRLNVIKTTKIMQLSENAYFLGEIPRIHEKTPMIEGDNLSDDSGIAVRTPKGIVAILGCGHSGLINITEFIKQEFNEPLFAIIGGFHLIDGKTNQEKIKYLFENYEKIFPMHCLNCNAIELFRSKNIEKLKTNEVISC